MVILRGFVISLTKLMAYAARPVSSMIIPLDIIKGDKRTQYVQVLIHPEYTYRRICVLCLAGKYKLTASWTMTTYLGKG